MPANTLSVMPSINCINLIKKFEGCNLHAYVDPGSGNLPITIGYGSTVYQNNLHVFLGQTISQDDAESLLLWDVNNKAKELNLVSPLLQCRLDAVVSFTYNVGLSAWNTSHLKQMIIANPADPYIRIEFMKWVHAGAVVMQGLVKRRTAEANLYFGN